MAKKRKTREQKIKIRLRKLEKQLQEKTEPQPLNVPVKPQKEKPVRSEVEANTKETAYSQAPKYLLADLRKTLALTLLAISLELVVYWWLKIK